MAAVALRDGDGGVCPGELGEALAAAATEAELLGVGCVAVKGAWDRADRGDGDPPEELREKAGDEARGAHGW